MIRRRIVRSERGSELVEFAFISPVLLFLFLGIVDFGFLFQAQEVVVNASREGARLAILESEGITDSDVETRVANYLAASLPPGSATPSTTVVNGTVSTPGGYTVSAKTVTVVYPYSFPYMGPIAGLLGSSFATINITASTTMRLEAMAGG